MKYDSFNKIKHSIDRTLIKEITLKEKTLKEILLKEILSFKFNNPSIDSIKKDITSKEKDFKEKMRIELNKDSIYSIKKDITSKKKDFKEKMRIELDKHSFDLPKKEINSLDFGSLDFGLLDINSLDIGFNKIKTLPFGCPDYLEDYKKTSLSFFTPVLISLAFLVTFLITISSIIMEKETKMKVVIFYSK
jgi:hypothetical protein